MLDQYDACSFGDVLFSQYLLVLLQQIYDPQLRKDLWIEHATALNYLRLKPDQVSSDDSTSVCESWLVLAFVPSGDTLHSLWKWSGTDSLLRSTVVKWNGEETRSSVALYDRHPSSQCFSLRSNTIRTVESTENDFKNTKTRVNERQSS